MDDEPLSFEEYRRQREESTGTIRCARCGEQILATSTRCPECGIHFQGEAQDCVHPSERSRSRSRRSMWTIVVVALLVAAIVVGFLGSL